MWQNIAVIIIGLITIAYIGRKIYRMLTTSKDPDSPCSGCSGCTLKDQINENKKNLANDPSCNHTNHRASHKKHGLSI